MMPRIKPNLNYNFKFTEFDLNDAEDLTASDIEDNPKIERMHSDTDCTNLQMKFDVDDNGISNMFNNLVDRLIHDSNALAESIIVKTLYDFGIHTFDEYLDDLSNGASMYNDAVDTVNEKLMESFEDVPYFIPKLHKMKDMDDVYTALDALRKNPYIKDYWNAALWRVI